MTEREMMTGSQHRQTEDVDCLESIYGSRVQHGSHNDRVYLMELDRRYTTEVIAMVESLAVEKGYGKIFVKIPASEWTNFNQAAYVMEASIPRLFGDDDGIFAAKYLSQERSQAEPGGELLNILKKEEQQTSRNGERNQSGEVVDICRPEDAEEMSRVYKQTFRTYPFPITNPQYLKNIMLQQACFVCVRRNNVIAAIASAEMNSVYKYAEMTDFSTLQQYRGRGYAELLLRGMEKIVRDKGINTAFTIARATSLGMNRVFQKCGYTYGGFLKNNTQISGRIESMTVWYKKIVIEG